MADPGAERPSAAPAPGRAGHREGKARRQPTLKVMEDSQDQHEGTHVKHGLLWLEKLKA